MAPAALRRALGAAAAAETPPFRSVRTSSAPKARTIARLDGRRGGHDDDSPAAAGRASHQQGDTHVTRRWPLAIVPPG